MSAFNRGASAPSEAECEPTTKQEHKVDEQDDLYDPDDEDDGLHSKPVEITIPKECPAEVDQYSNPEEPPEEFCMDYFKEHGITGFMVKVASRLRTLKSPQEFVRVRHYFWDLIRELKVDTTAQPPYNQLVADRIRKLLEERGLAETLLLDFELLVHIFEEKAQKHREQVEKRKQEHEAEQRKKQEWDVVKKEDAEDDWEMV